MSATRRAPDASPIASDAAAGAEVTSGPDFLTRLDEIERGLHAYIADAFHALRDEFIAQPTSGVLTTDVAIPLAVAAQQLGVSKDALRKRVKRLGVGINRGGRLCVYQAALSELYRRCPSSTLSTRSSRLSTRIDGGDSAILRSNETAAGDARGLIDEP